MSKHTDLKDCVFGKLTVVGRGTDYISPSGAHLLRWRCKCECGNLIDATTSQLKRGLKSCGCVSRREDLSGKQFGELTVLFPVEDYVSPKGTHMSKWHCRCSCGNEIDATGMSLKNGDTKSCGCMRKGKKNRQKKDLSGQQYGDLFALERIEDSRPPKYKCKCACGREVVVLQKQLSNGTKTHCGCKNADNKTKHVQNKRSQHDFVGETIGQLFVLEELEPHVTPNGSKQRKIKCRCSCGNTFITRLASAQKNGKCRDCLNKEHRKDLTGKRFGKLVVVSMAEDYISPSGHRLSRCNCLCDCGKTITVNMSALVTGTTKSCGCLHNIEGLLKDNPELMKKTDRKKNANINIEEITARTSKKVWWKCDKCGNSWLATVASQNDKKKHGCPYCSGSLVIKGKTDLLARFPDVVNDWWDYEKNTVKPDEISAYSGKKVWWKCKEGHSWQSTVANKVNGSGCPRCNLEKVSSFCEQAVFYYIKQAYPDAVNGDKHIGVELDVYIPSIRVAIEYDGDAWHKSEERQKNDAQKNRKCSDCGIRLIRIREPNLPPLNDCVCIIRTDSTTSKSLDAAINELFDNLGLDRADINTDRDTGVILSQFATKKYENSLAYCFPEIAKEWHPTKNGSLTADKINKASRRKVWWLGTCGHEWQMTVGDRTRLEYRDRSGHTHKAYGCPVCSGKKLLPGFNDLQTRWPEIAEEWHPTKNGELKATDVMPGSKEKVWWLGKCGHEWQAPPNKRCGKPARGCPICSKKRKSPPVICVETSEVYKNGMEAAKQLGLQNASGIYRCCRGEGKSAAGYHWKYAEETD